MRMYTPRYYALTRLATLRSCRSSLAHGEATESVIPSHFSKVEQALTEKGSGKLVGVFIKKRPLVWLDEGKD